MPEIGVAIEHLASPRVDGEDDRKVSGQFGQLGDDP
jgi:hypothetical protein